MNVSQETEETTQLQTGELEDLEALALEEHKGDWVESGGYRVFGDESKKDEGGVLEDAKKETTTDKGETESKVDKTEVQTKPTMQELNDEDELEGDEDDEVDDEYEEDENDYETELSKEVDESAVVPKGNVPPHMDYSKEDANTKQTDNSAESTNLESSQPKTIDNAGSQSSSESNVNTGNKSADNTFTQERLLATRAAAQSLVTLLENYYYGPETSSKMLLKSWVGPWDFTSSINNNDEMVQKLVDTMLRALVTPDQKEFIIGTIGSSVAAGHDNCQYDSYENQLQRTLSPVWEAAGMKLLCQNGGEGGGCGDTFANQVFCIKQNVSPKIDIAHYSWSYYEVGDYEGALKSRESLIRWTQMLPRQPPVHVINVEGATEAAASEKEMQSYYAKYGYNAFYMRYAYREGGYDYDTEMKNGIDRFGWGFVGDGYHNTTRYGELEEDEGRRESLGVVMRNWHPGPIGFQLIADAFSIVYSKAILIALDIIEDIIAEGHDPNDIWSASKRKIVSKKSLPNPLHCDPEYCVVDEAPGCLNYELPTYGAWGPRVEDPNDELNPHKGEVQNWETWYEPRDFWYLVAKEDVVFYQDREDKEICKHLDNCAGISATSSENGMVVFRLPKME
jgi:hypothetical protein